MKMQFKINLTFDDSFETKIFTSHGEIFGPEFRKHFLGYLGHLLKLEEGDKCIVDSFIIKKLSDDAPQDPDIRDDVSGDAV